MLGLLLDGSETAWLVLDLIDPSDALPFPITEKLVSARARMLAYQWAEGNRDPTIPRGQTADYKFLYQSAAGEYAIELKLIGKKDRDNVDIYKSKLIRDSGPAKRNYYSTILGRAFGN